MKPLLLGRMRRSILVDCCYVLSAVVILIKDPVRRWFPTCPVLSLLKPRYQWVLNELWEEWTFHALVLEDDDDPALYLLRKHCCINGVVAASFVSRPATVSASVGQVVDFTCLVANKSTDTWVEWWFLHHNLQISTDNNLLTDDSTHFSVFNRRLQNACSDLSIYRLKTDGLWCRLIKFDWSHRATPFTEPEDLFCIRGSLGTNGEPCQYESRLRISSIQRLDNGYYKCQLVPGPSILQQINTLIVADGTGRLTTTTPSTPHANFTNCCIQERVGALCLPMCAPGSFELSVASVLNCSSHVLQLLKCSSGERNHVPCCVRKRVPDSCLGLCGNQVPLPLMSSQLRTCAAYIHSLLDCFQEGYYVLPIPPASVTAEVVSETKVLVAWQPLPQIGDEELSFRVFYQQASASVYRSTQLTEDFSFSVDNLRPETRYRFYVITINKQGSSQPSYFVEVTTHQDTEVTPSSSDVSLLACCEEQRVKPLCREFLCVGDVTSTNPDVDLLPCYSDIDKVFQCISGMRNNTDCCIRHGLSPACYPLCDGQLSQMTFDQLDCFQEMAVISNCFQESHENIPGHPADVALVSVTSTSAAIRWNPPKVGANRVRHFTVRCRQQGEPLYTLVSVFSSNYTLLGLLPSTLYEVAVASVGDRGTSLPSPAVVFLTYWTRSFELASGSSLPATRSALSTTRNFTMLPSMPRELTVVNRTTHTIIVRWRPPLANAPLIKRYIVRYRPTSNSTGLWHSVTVGSLSVILQNLLSDSSYSVKVLAESEQGTSLPTSELIFRTLPGCCRAKQVSDLCLPLCAGTDEIGLHDCGHDLTKIIQCAAGNEDHTQCCSRMNIPSHCLAYCRGMPEVNSFPGVICVSFITQIFACFHDDFENLPSPPFQFSYTEIGSRHVVFTWREPPQNSAPVIYNLYYTSRSDNATYTVPNVRSPYRLTDLKPLSQYDAYLVAENTFGTSSMPTVTLTVFTSSENSNLPTVHQDPEGFIAVGSKVTLRCFSSGGSSVYWLHRNKQFDGSVFEIDAATEEDGGRYTCVVRERNVDSADIILRIQYAPDIDPRFQNVEVEAGKDQMAHLECHFLGYPDTVEWQRMSGKPLWPSHSIGSRFTTATYVVEDEGIVVAQLSINQVTADDFDWYTCRGSNDFASITGYVMVAAPGVTLRLQPSPFAPRVENVVACCLQKDVSLSCISACIFDVDMSAVRLKRMQCNSDLPKMVECSADGRNHSKCCASRQIPSRCLSLCSGIVPAPVDLTCLAHVNEIVDCMEMGHETLPSRPLNLTVSVSWNVSVRWLAPAVNPHLVQYYEVACTVVGPRNSTLRQVTANADVRFMELRNLTSFMTYRVTVTAHNHHGSSVPSEAIYFNMQEPMPSSPSNVTVLVIDSFTIQVSWGHPEVNWESVGLYCIYFIAEDVETNWSKVVVGQSVFQSMLRGLRSHTVYRVYMTAMSPHFESPPSAVVKVLTPDPDDRTKGRVMLGVGLFFLFFISVLIITALVCWCVRFLRRRRHSQFKESVSFENPSYTSLGDGRIRLPIIQERNNIHSTDGKAGNISDSSSGEAVYVDNVILKEANIIRNIGYATLPTSDSHSNASSLSVANGKTPTFSSC